MNAVFVEQQNVWFVQQEQMALLGQSLPVLPATFVMLRAVSWDIEGNGDFMRSTWRLLNQDKRAFAASVISADSRLSWPQAWTIQTSPQLKNAFFCLFSSRLWVFNSHIRRKSLKTQEPRKLKPLLLLSNSKLHLLNTFWSTGFILKGLASWKLYSFTLKVTHKFRIWAEYKVPTFPF